MKKNILTLALIIPGVMFFAPPAWAATTASLSPASAEAAIGQDFNMTVSVNPQGASNYTAKIELNYPADILEIKSFSLEKNWMSLTQPGYDLIDNEKGVLIKTAGYPGGFSSTTTFGTVSFNAKKDGAGVIKIGNGSLAFEAASQATITGDGVNFTIAAPVIVPVVAPVIAPEIPMSAEKTVPAFPKTTKPAKVVSPLPTSTEQIAASSQTAAVGAASPAEKGSVWTWVMIIAVLAVGIYAGYGFLGNRDRGI